ncbi:hypothetical protein [Dyella acidiphila]|uniref:Uncharacterized protein n=1 Tax=Dyella acidiphila TaxID=2775866 RepID=A0ABR9GCL4_9GAMM|nr:hypothetical protein [Dyella acidiphila]MBE1161781.1 hypothetical protein [Dyella acidiphila]
MSKTIELLERIGQDASLRHASPEDLAQVLGELNASEGLKVAAASGDKDGLIHELGPKHHPMNPPNNPGHGGCDPCEDDPDNVPQHDEDEADKAHSPPDHKR